MNNALADSLASTVAQHEVRLDSLEHGRDRLEDKIDGLRGWLVGILASSLGSVLLGLMLYLLPVRK